ncbi:glycoside hydrolase family 26 protein [Actinoplanes sp. NPDC051859]|uniref:glycoside hydrolase family 26 protein n=1 Tax=Actinoplanes sp. NPDC051859 TaxID=3363909 RepID=UPI0037B652A4
MRRGPRRSRFVHLAAITTVFSISVVATLSWAWTGGVDQIGLPYGPEPVVLPGPAATSAPGTPGGPPSPAEPGVPAWPGLLPSAAPSLLPSPSASAAPTARPGQVDPAPAGSCRTGKKLVPTCGVLWGVAPGAFTEERGRQALTSFEKKTERHQDIYHAYHRGNGQVFPTKEEMAIAREPGRERVLFLNWKPRGASWAKIAKGDKATDKFLDKLAEHIKKNYTEQFFFTVHHEAEDNVKEKAGSGYTAKDYSRMFRYVVQRLRADGVDNLVTVLVHMAYVPHTSQKWFDSMYPGNDVVDWIGFDTYAYSDPGYGHGDFRELLNRQASNRPTWPGFYNWAVERHPDKPLMVAEWGVWSSKKNPGHKAEFYREVGQQIRDFPKIRAMVHFDTPHNQEGRESSVDATPESLAAYRKLGKMPIFQVEVAPALP